MTTIEKTQKNRRLIHTLLLFEFKDVEVFRQNRKAGKTTDQLVELGVGTDKIDDS